MEKNFSVSAPLLRTAFNVANVFTALQSACPSFAVAKRFFRFLQSPVERLSRYYSRVLERPVGQRLTWALLEAQSAFFLGILPATLPLWVRLAALAWFGIAVVRCKRLSV